jgi:hypothetical protein
MAHDIIGRIEEGVALSSAVSTRLRIAVLLVLALALIGIWVNEIETRVAEHDEEETIQLALNLVRHGVQSMEKVAPYTPSMTREPLPVVTTAAAILIVDAFMGQAPDEAYFSGTRAGWLRGQNVIWMAVTVVAAFWIVWSASASFGLSTLAAVLCGLLPVISGIVMRLDQLDTEAPSVALLLIASWLLIVGVVRERIALVAVSGLVFGCSR